MVPRSLTLMLLKEVSWARERLNFPETEHGLVSSEMKIHVLSRLEIWSALNILQGLSRDNPTSDQIQ